MDNINNKAMNEGYTHHVLLTVLNEECVSEHIITCKTSIPSGLSVEISTVQKQNTTKASRKEKVQNLCYVKYAVLTIDDS